LHSWTRVVLADGTIKRNGQPFPLMQLYERNIAHLSPAPVARDAIARGVRFPGPSLQSRFALPRYQ